MTRNLMYCFMSIFVIRPRLGPAAPAAVGVAELAMGRKRLDIFLENV